MPLRLASPRGLQLGIGRGAWRWVRRVSRAHQMLGMCVLGSGGQQVLGAADLGWREGALGGPSLARQLHQHMRHKQAGVPRRAHLRTAAFWKGQSSTSEPEPAISEKRRLLLSYVQEVEPTIVEQFIEQAPPQVVDALTQTVSNMVGTLPPQFFTVTVQAHGENLAQLMFSCMMTGYLFRNAQYRLELTHSLALPPGDVDASGTSFLPLEAGEYAPGTQKARVTGEVIRWNNESGPEAIPAAVYIDSLEEELRTLRRQLAQHRALIKQSADPAERNALLEYLKALDAPTLEELTACADDDTVEAMNSFIHRVLGTDSDTELRRITSESNAAELSHTLFYLGVVGYLLRTLEVRFTIASSMDGSTDGGDSDDGGLPGLLAGL